MHALSPATRRILAIGLLILALLLALQWLLLPLAGTIQAQREELVGLRSRAAHLAAVRDQPLPRMSSLPAHSTIRAAAAGPALDQLKVAVNQAASAAGVTLRGMIAHSAADRSGALLALDIDATGSEEAITRFVGLLEDGDPLVRFESWRLQAGATPDQPLALSGRLAAAWERQG